MIKHITSFLLALMIFSTASAYAGSNSNHDYYDEMWEMAHNGDSFYQYELSLLFGSSNDESDNSCGKGQFYAGGQCRLKSDEQFFYWTKLAAEQGNRSALNNLGYCYNNGIGVEQDQELALDYYIQAAEKGEVIAQYNLGLMYTSGIIKDYELAEYFFLKAIANDHPNARLELAKLYLYYDQTKAEKALPILKQIYSLERGSIDSIWASALLANYYENNKDYQNATSWYQKSFALLPNDKLLNRDNYKLYPLPHLSLSLAWNMLNGYGIEQNIPKAITLFYQTYQKFLQVSEPDEVKNFLVQSIYFSSFEEQWTHLFLDVMLDRFDYNDKRHEQLFEDIFPNQPDMMTRFHQQIMELKAESALKKSPKILK